jgi:membrane-associated phospholipid phosphatase
MTEKISKIIAQSISNVFNPLTIPTFGFLIIMNKIPVVEFYSDKIKAIIIGVVFVSTCLLPGLFIMLTSLNSEIIKLNTFHQEKIIPYIFIAFSTFLGAQFLGKLPLLGIFKFLLIGSAVVAIALTIITIMWKISSHTTAVGALFGTLLALNLKYSMNFLWIIIAILLISGAIASSQIYLEKHTPSQVYAGFGLGLLCMFSLIVYI